MEYALFEKRHQGWVILWTYDNVKALDADLSFYRNVLGMTVQVFGRAKGGRRPVGFVPA